MKEPILAEAKPVSRTRRVLAYLLRRLMFALVMILSGVGFLFHEIGPDSEWSPVLFLILFPGLTIMVLLWILMLWLRIDAPSS